MFYMDYTYFDFIAFSWMTFYVYTIQQFIIIHSVQVGYEFFICNHLYSN
jgi:hypothetical protein